MNAKNTLNNDLISVQLRTLINLAKPASQLKLKKSSIRSRQNGGYVSPSKGRGMEFDESRLYQPGDDIRSIDWRVTARTGKTHTKIYREERERPVFISVDDRPAMHFATRGVFKSVQAAKIAALLAWTAQEHGDRIGGQIYTDLFCQEIKPQNGKHAVLHFLNTIIKTDSIPQTEMNLEQALARLNQHTRPGSLVYIISDFRGLNHKSENHLVKLARHCDVVLIQVYDALESQLPKKGRYRFTNNEDRSVVVDTSDNQFIHSYQKLFQTRLKSLQKISKKMGIVFFQCSTTDDPVKVLR
ncbi:MAG: DUF58 domain-containing protein [Methylococcales bacterium]|nr:DUF58 domain-containing protein [Methylococcales bacterium]